MKYNNKAIDCLPHKRIEQFCQEWGISRLSFFGDILSDQFSEESNIDMLVDFLPELHNWRYQEQASREMEKILGRRVDMSNFGEIENLGAKFVRDYILGTAVEYYDAKK